MLDLLKKLKFIGKSHAKAFFRGTSRKKAKWRGFVRPNNAFGRKIRRTVNIGILNEDVSQSEKFLGEELSKMSRNFE